MFVVVVDRSDRDQAPRGIEDLVDVSRCGVLAGQRDRPLLKAQQHECGHGAFPASRDQSVPERPQGFGGVDLDRLTVEVEPVRRREHPIADHLDPLPEHHAPRERRDLGSRPRRRDTTCTNPTSTTQVP
ncbi:hypothetical protein [Embleya scabrispora]|uniref:hypothetical protein n=1 Tax=Embleya scabrispora TaxID=159449 RepID=UPI00047631DB|nr:hypothetical protein [Embleya scabrispora]MYS80728.1 hypothetical protein [Streptomyces sp. SID5474]